MTQQLHFCGGCGSEQLSFDGQKEHRCQQCGWIYFGNPAAAAAALLWHDGELLMVRRGRDPGKGLLDLPGGFVDPDESAEEALKRELIEELNLPLDDFHYVGSFPNRYLFASIEYTVVDLVFQATLKSRPIWHDDDELAGLHWCDPKKLRDEEIAFASVRKYLRALT